MYDDCREQLRSSPTGQGGGRSIPRQPTGTSSCLARRKPWGPSSGGSWSDCTGRRSAKTFGRNRPTAAHGKATGPRRCCCRSRGVPWCSAAKFRSRQVERALSDKSRMGLAVPPTGSCRMELRKPDRAARFFANASAVFVFVRTTVSRVVVALFVAAPRVAGLVSPASCGDVVGATGAT